MNDDGLPFPSTHTATLKGSDGCGPVPSGSMRKTYSPVAGNRCMVCSALGRAQAGDIVIGDCIRQRLAKRLLSPPSVPGR